MNSVREDLKYFTKPFHDRIEQSSGARALLNGDLSENLYQRILMNHYIFLKPIEVELERMDWSLFNFDIKGHLRTSRLNHDLLNLNVPANSIASLPYFEFLPQMNSHAKCLGVLYVVEGSMMGGRIITKKLETIFGEKANAITNYFRGFDDQSITKWNQLCSCLETNSNYANEKEQIIISACETFLLWEKCLNTIN